MILQIGYEANRVSPLPKVRKEIVNGSSKSAQLFRDILNSAALLHLLGYFSLI